jgi:hypothetical protein
MTPDRAALVERVAREIRKPGKTWAEAAAAAVSLIRAETLEEAETAVVHALMPNKAAVAAAAAAIRALKGDSNGR